MTDKEFSKLLDKYHYERLIGLGRIKLVKFILLV